MSFHRPDTTVVEKRKLTQLSGLVQEITDHIERNSLAHPGHMRYLNSRLQKLEDLVQEITPNRLYPNEIMD